MCPMPLVYSQLKLNFTFQASVLKHLISLCLDSGGLRCEETYFNLKKIDRTYQDKKQRQMQILADQRFSPLLRMTRNCRRFRGKFQMVQRTEKTI